MTATDDVAPEAGVARRRLIEFVRDHGIDYANGKIIEPVGPAGDCWTHAWHVAQTVPGRTYVEGICLLRGQTAAHAWTVDAAGVVYEHTEGYERAGAYIGYPLDTTPGSEVMRADSFLTERRRCSMLEGILVHATPEQVIARWGRG